MAVDTQQVLDAADQVGKLVVQHPIVDRYHQAQKSLADDPDATRLLNDFNRQLTTLARQEESGMRVTDAQRNQLEDLQRRLASHLKIKALNLAQVEFIDLLRQVSDRIRKYLADASAAPRKGDGPAPGGAAPSGPRIVV